MQNYLPRNVLPISAWAEEDRPREKLENKGKAALSDAELLAIILGSGSREETAVSLSKRILKSVEGNLHRLGQLDLSDLQQFKGVGSAKAIGITAALELGRRRQFHNNNDRVKIKSSRDSYNLLAPKLMDLPHEEFWIILLNRALQVTSQRLVSRGGYKATVVDVRLVFKEAMKGDAACMILCHNHPSGNCFPSEEDIRITKRLCEGAKIMDIQILDHIIVAGSSYYSFADEGMI